jgi:hypothetical protein
MLYLTDNVYRCNAAWNVFNQPLSWDTSRVTNMGDMFTVRCSPRPVPPNLLAEAVYREGVSLNTSDSLTTWTLA